MYKRGFAIRTCLLLTPYIKKHTREQIWKIFSKTYFLYIPYIFPKYFPYMFPCVFLDLWSQQKTSPLFSGGFRPHLELLGHDGHVHVPTFNSISQVSDPKLCFCVISK